MRGRRRRNAARHGPSPQPMSSTLRTGRSSRYSAEDNAKCTLRSRRDFDPKPSRRYQRSKYCSSYGFFPVIGSRLKSRTLMTRIPRLRSLVSAEGLVGAILAVIAIPQLLLGPGTDLDVGAVLASGRLITKGDYRPSRPPGAPVHEAIVGVFERVGGTTLSNAVTLVAALAIVAAVVVLSREAGLSRPYLVAAVVVANPWFIVAATSTVDFPLALAFLIWGAIALQRDQTVVASVCFALAVGCRATTILLVMAALVADVTGEHPKPRRALLCGALASGLGLALYIPAFVSAGGSLAFAQNDFSTASPGDVLGRALRSEEHT